MKKKTKKNKPESRNAWLYRAAAKAVDVESKKARRESIRMYGKHPFGK